MVCNRILVVGNPGAGKSSLLNCMIGEAMFQAGPSFGKGLTTTMQCETRRGCTFIDTPGLADAAPDCRKFAAGAITEGLKQDGDYKVLFVLSLESGRVRPSDVVTIRLVLEACKSLTKFGVLVNKMPPKEHRAVNARLPNGRTPAEIVMQTVATALPPTRAAGMQLHFCARDEDLEAEKDAVKPLALDLQVFVQNLPSVHIRPADVSQVHSDEFESLCEHVESRLKEAEDDVAKLEAQLKESGHNVTALRQALAKGDMAVQELAAQRRDNEKAMLAAMEKQQRQHQHERDQMEKRTTEINQRTAKILEDERKRYTEELAQSSFAALLSDYVVWHRWLRRMTEQNPMLQVAITDDVVEPSGGNTARFSQDRQVATPCACLKSEDSAGEVRLSLWFGEAKDPELEVEEWSQVFPAGECLRAFPIKAPKASAVMTEVPDPVVMPEHLFEQRAKEVGQALAHGVGCLDETVGGLRATAGDANTRVRDGVVRAFTHFREGREAAKNLHHTCQQDVCTLVECRGALEGKRESIGQGQKDVGTQLEEWKSEKDGLGVRIKELGREVKELDRKAEDARREVREKEEQLTAMRAGGGAAFAVPVIGWIAGGTTIAIAETAVKKAVENAETKVRALEAARYNLQRGLERQKQRLQTASEVLALKASILRGLGARSKQVERQQAVWQQRMKQSQTLKEDTSKLWQVVTEILAPATVARDAACGVAFRLQLLDKPLRALEENLMKAFAVSVLSLKGVNLKAWADTLSEYCQTLERPLIDQTDVADLI